MCVLGFSSTACQCFSHASDCFYDPEVEKNRASLDTFGRYDGGGVCINCQVWNSCQVSTDSSRRVCVVVLKGNCRAHEWSMFNIGIGIVENLFRELNGVTWEGSALSALRLNLWISVCLAQHCWGELWAVHRGVLQAFRSATRVAIWMHTWAEFSVIVATAFKQA